MGKVHALASRGQHDEARPTLADKHRPSTMERFKTHVELHRGLMIARGGDHPGGVAYAEAALAALPSEKRSQSLTLMLEEIKRKP